MKTVILVPRRDGIPERDKAWAWCKARWEAILPEAPIFEGHHDDGPFNRSAAINRAARAAGDWDQAIVIDSDIFVRQSQIRLAIETAERTGKVTWAHRRWRGMNEYESARLVADQRDLGPEYGDLDMDLWVEKTTGMSWSCCFVVPRRVFDDAGGFDERFEGWGYEDMAWQSLVKGLYGWERIEDDVYHLWHPRSDERITAGQPAITATREYNRNARLGRRYMVAVLRDHGIGDQAGEERLSPEIVAVHVKNLTDDDARVAMRQSVEEQRRWDAMGWPTLEELRDQAKEARAALPAVTLIVHSGGERDQWVARRGYLEASLASLMENVSGPVAKRVIYDCWGDAWIRAELMEIAEPLGFYVVGPDRRPDYKGGMQQMWRYLDQRCSTPFVFQAEDDFVYDRPIDLAPMIETLEANRHLRQMALLRAPYYAREIEAGSIIAEHPEAYQLQNSRPFPFLEHRLYFTANPSLFRRSLCQIAWPGSDSSEKGYTDILNRDPKSRFGLWGSGEAWISHIGAERAGSGY